MRVHVRGPGLGPVRTTLWSSGHGRKHSQWWALLGLPFAGIMLWQAIQFAWMDVILGVFAVLAFAGWRAERSQKAAARTEPPAVPERPAPQAEWSDRR